MLTGAAVFLLFLVALLAVPMTLRFQVSWRESLRDDVRLQWAFGLLRVRIPLSPAKKPAAEDEEDREESDGSARRPRKKRNFFAAFRVAKFRQRLFRFLGDFWRAVQKNDLNFRLRLGLGDPAETGQLWAVVGPLAGMLAGVRNASIAIEPEFSDATFELDTSGSIRVVPLQMIYLILGLLLSPSVWQGMRRMRAVA